ncbi:hypothetical protein [Flavobacterium daejeonense]|uniref:hypothetical protein n=1 Tax=Flavobacterium daejeonense TaxID=350893 RepID=UPI0012DC1C4B|nr:hypothetical protein [Flavobacterium daejeonense]
MKKLSLKNAESMLSRKEMKMINGGYGSCTSGNYIDSNHHLWVCYQGSYIDMGVYYPG